MMIISMKPNNNENSNTVITIVEIQRPLTGRHPHRFWTESKVHGPETFHGPMNRVALVLKAKESLETTSSHLNTGVFIPTTPTDLAQLDTCIQQEAERQACDAWLDWRICSGHCRLTTSDNLVTDVQCPAALPEVMPKVKQLCEELPLSLSGADQWGFLHHESTEQISGMFETRVSHSIHSIL